MIRFLLLALVFAPSCAGPVEAPLHPPRHAKPQVRQQVAPPPPPPDYSYDTAPATITTVLADPDATIEAFVLTNGDKPGPRFHSFPIVRTEILRDLKRDHVAATLTSGVTYGHLIGFCTSSGIGFRLSSKRHGSVDVWMDPASAEVEIFGERPKTCALSLSGVRLLGELRRQLSGEDDCGSGT